MFWNPLLWSSSILFPNPHLSLSRWATDFISTAPTQQRIYHAQQTLVKGFCASLQKNRKTSLKSAFAPPDTYQRPIHLFDLVSMRQSSILWADTARARLYGDLKRGLKTWRALRN